VHISVEKYLPLIQGDNDEP